MATAPTIRSRAAWGAATAIGSGRYVSPSARRYFVVHWPVLSDQDEATMVRTIERLHHQQGWAAAPGYNFLVGNRTGTIFEGAGRDVRGIHTPPHNTDGWGCCVLQPMNAPLSDEAKRSTRQLYDWLCTVAGRQLQMWWHGRDYATECPGPNLRAWVQSGMQIGAGPAPPPPTPAKPQVVEGNMNASAVAANGTLHMWSVGPQRKAIWLTTQRKGQTAWGGGETGKRVAGLVRWAIAPEGRTFVGISAARSDSGVLNFFATLDDGSVMDRWQRPNETAWNPANGLRPFAPKP